MNDKQKVFKALRDPNWDWRTMPGLIEATQLPAEKILAVILRNRIKIEVRNSESHGLVFRLRSKSKAKPEPLFERALDYLSLGKRTKVA